MMNRQGRTQLVLGLLLILLGAWFLADRNLPAFHQLAAKYMEWPVSLVSIGAGIFLLGLILGAPGMSVPAAIVAGIGGIFYYFENIGHWGDWYMWLLVPGFVGVGSILAGLLGEHTSHNMRRGLNLVVISAILFLVFSSFLGGWDKLGNYGPAILIILLGLWLLGRGIFKTWQDNRVYRKPVERRVEAPREEHHE
jgi:cytochrome bd-type quinol oxidase subunit 2